MLHIQLLNYLIDIASLHDAVVGSSGAQQQLRYIGRQAVTRALPKDTAAGSLQPKLRDPSQFTELLECQDPRAVARKNFDKGTGPSNEEHMC